MTKDSEAINPADADRTSAPVRQTAGEIAAELVRAAGTDTTVGTSTAAASDAGADMAATEASVDVGAQAHADVEVGVGAESRVDSGDAGEVAVDLDGEDRGRNGSAVGISDEDREGVPEILDDEEFRAALEAMLLIVDAPAPVDLLASALDDSEQRVQSALREMSAELTARRSGMDLRFVGDGWRYYTRTDFAPYVERMLLDGARSKLTRAALETLAVIAYRQPVTRARVSAVRGVNVDGVIRTLVARGLIAEAGTDPETNGTLYVTTELFLERIGLASLTELPSLAPLLPGVDLIDEINDSLDTDPRYTKLRKPAEADIDLGSQD